MTVESLKKLKSITKQLNNKPEITKTEKILVKDCSIKIKHLKDLKKLKYENVWVDNVGKLNARLYDPKKEESTIHNFGYNFVPPLFVGDENGGYTSFVNGKPLKKIEFKKSSDIYFYLKSNDPSKIYGYNNRVHHFIREMFPNPLDSNHKFHEWFLDIETRSNEGFPKPEHANQQITMIQIYDNRLSSYLILGLKEFTGEFEQKNAKYIQLGNEIELLNTFLKLLNSRKPTCIKSFNGMLFDYPYITNRMKNLGLDYESLSPTRNIEYKDCMTQDGMTGETTLWKGTYLVDLRELFLKYAYAGLPKNSLDTMAKHYGFEGKVDHSEFDTFDGQYTGKGYIFPKEVPPKGSLDYQIYETQINYKENPTDENLKLMEQACFNKFVIYSITDVEQMVKVENKAKLFEKAKGIAYTCGVNMDEVMGTLKQWKSFVYNECIKDKIVLPIEQHYGDKDAVYKAGWTTSIPGKYGIVASFDYTSLYPSLFRAFNIGTDSMVKPEELESMPELKEIKQKYFYYFTTEYMAELTARGENDNDVVSETEYYDFLFKNKDKITPILKKYNVTATPNGQFFRKDRESISSVLMGRIFNGRVAHKRKAQDLYSRMENVIKQNSHYENDDGYIKLKNEQEYEENMADVLKIFINSFYGAGALHSNPFSSGRLTNASVTISGRCMNKMMGYRVNTFINDYKGEDAGLKLDNIVQADTDSIYVSLDKLVPNDTPKDKSLEITTKIVKNYIEPEIVKHIRDYGELFNMRQPEVLQAENEVISRGFISVAPKRYFTRVLVKDGTLLQKPKIKVTGISLKGKSTPLYLREKLEPVLEMVLDKDEDTLKRYIDDTMGDFLKTGIDNLARKVKVSSLAYEKRDGKYKRYVPDKNKFLTAPINSHASLVYNEYIKNNKLNKQYNYIEPSDAISYIYLQQPNIFGSQSIAYKDPKFTGLIPPEIVDREIHFDKDFKQKIRIITNAIGWNIDSTTKDMIDGW
jgi:DNA polymerase elongation subunit (family B)